MFVQLQYCTQCECPDWKFEHERSVCEYNFWDSRSCKCRQSSLGSVEYSDNRNDKRKEEECLIVWGFVVSVLVVIMVFGICSLYSKTREDKQKYVDDKQKRIRCGSQY